MENPITRALEQFAFEWAATGADAYAGDRGLQFMGLIGPRHSRAPFLPLLPE